MDNQVVVTGASGWIGGHVCRLLHERGRDVIGVTRNPELRRHDVPEITWIGVGDQLETAVSRAGTVLNLAGRNVLEQNWTPEYIEIMRASRLDLTRRIVDALRTSSAATPRLVSASGYPVVGDTGDRIVTEDQPPSRDLVMGAIDADWEEIALSAAPPIAVTVLRIGIVLGSDGGALSALRQPFDAGAGVVLGDGNQWMPWIEIHDAAGLIAEVVDDPDYGAISNVVAPVPARHRDFARALGDTLGVPWDTPIPADDVTGMLGGVAELLLHSQRMIPGRALERGFRFQHLDIHHAIAGLVGRNAVLAETEPVAHRVSQ
jgi:uncharacterized protein